MKPLELLGRACLTESSLKVKRAWSFSKFLSVLKFGTRNVYSLGLAAFQQFYSDQGSLEDFYSKWPDPIQHFSPEIR